MTSTTESGLEEFKLFIGGKAVDARSGRTFQSQNPFTDKPWAVIADGGPEDVDDAVAAARAAYDGDWGQMTGFARAAILRDVAEGIGRNRLLTIRRADGSRCGYPVMSSTAARPLRVRG